jgi:hypothetical protein
MIMMRANRKNSDPGAKTAILIPHSYLSNRIEQQRYETIKDI